MSEWFIEQTDFERIDSYSDLPASPETDDLIFYTPLNILAKYDGSDWVGPPMMMPMFGRQGRGNFSVWLRGIGRADVFPRTIAGTVQTLGYYSPEFSEGGGGNSYKLLKMTTKSDQAITGDVELHESANLVVPSWASTGKERCQFTASKYSDVDSDVILNSHGRWSCYYRHTSGVWDNLEVMLVMSLVISGAS